MNLLAGCRVVVTDHGAFVLLNVYVPNAGDRKREGGERVDFKCRFLSALKEKADSFVASGREVCLSSLQNIFEWRERDLMHASAQIHYHLY